MIVGCWVVIIEVLYRVASARVIERRLAAGSGRLSAFAAAGTVGSGAREALSETFPPRRPALSTNRSSGITIPYSTRPPVRRNRPARSPWFQGLAPPDCRIRAARGLYRLEAGCHHREIGPVPP